MCVCVYVHMFMCISVYVYVCIYICVCMCMYICMCIQIDSNMHLRKLISDFLITSNLFLSVQDLVSGFQEFQFELKISKVTIVYIFTQKSTRDGLPQFTFYSCCLSLLKVSFSF